MKLAPATLALFTLLAAPAAADLRTVDSLEWTASQCDVVAEGTVVSWQPLEGEDWTLHLKPTRGLKGGSAAGDLFVMRRGDRSFTPGERVVAFGTRRPSWGHVGVLVLTEGATGLTRDGATVSGLDAIVAALAYADELRRVAPMYLPLASSSPDDTASLRVPADHRTERLVQVMLRSQALSERALAALSIAPFESSENIAQLRALLADRSTFPGSSTPVVCHNALYTLQRWEVPVAADACERPVVPATTEDGRAWPPWGW